jgi:hypothetical protein
MATGRLKSFLLFFAIFFWSDKKQVVLRQRLGQRFVCARVARFFFG